MQAFVGRARQLRDLDQELVRARRGEGRLVAVRGRRQVGKSRLVSEFVERYDGPSLFFEAHGYTETRELERFREKLSASTLPSAALAGGGVAFSDWEAALLAAASNASRETPSVIVIDEFPELCERGKNDDGTIKFSPQEGSVRAAWRTLERLPVVVILVGSDLSMMESIAVYGAPLYQRPTREMLVPPLSPLEAARLSGRSGAEAIDAYLVTGGFPRLVGSFRDDSLEDFLVAVLSDADSDLVRIGRRMVEGDLPSGQGARSVLSVVGAGERTLSGISNGTGFAAKNLTVPRGPLTALTARRIVASALPLSTEPSKGRRYWVDDTYLRFWLRFIEPASSEIERGLGHLIASRIAAAFRDYSGSAVEPLVRTGIERLSIAGDETFDGARAVGSYWTRSNQVQVDLVGAERDTPPVDRVAFVGSIKWREAGAFTASDASALQRLVDQVPGAGAGTRWVAVSRMGFARRIAAPVRRVEPDELLAAFPAD
ncbi:MAG: AAA family ATPase [Actinomycetota bacterium]|nr:AAA family ATPase [Actinomycetota bacterium]